MTDRVILPWLKQTDNPPVPAPPAPVVTQADRLKRIAAAEAELQAAIADLANGTRSILQDAAAT